ncbi:unnamed protein product [Closterium sp. Naga37s-1]|nr:unnamed protein product [Closterium sp. Naga37s-1]
MSVLLSPVFPPLLTAPCFSPFPSASAAAGTHALAPASSSLSSISAAASIPTPAPTCSSFSSASGAAGTHAQVPSFSSFSSPSATAHALTFSFFSSPSATAHALTFVARPLPPSLPPLRSPMASLLRSTAQEYSGSCSPSSSSSSSLAYNPACLSLFVPPRSDIITPLLLSFSPLLPMQVPYSTRSMPFLAALAPADPSPTQASSGPSGWGSSLGHLHAPPSASLHLPDASLPLQGTAPGTAALCPLAVAPSLLPSRLLVTAHLLSCLACPPRAPFLFLVSATRLLPRNLHALPSLGAPDPVFPFLLPFLPLHPAGIALLRPSSHVSLYRATFLLFRLFPLQPSSLPAGVLLLSHDALPHLPLRRWVTNVRYPCLAPSPPAAASLLASAERAFLHNPRPPPLPTTTAISFLPSPYASCPPGFVLARANDTLLLAQHGSSPPPLAPLTRAQQLCSSCASRHSRASPLAHDLHPRFAPGASHHSHASPLAHDLHPRFAPGALRHSRASPLLAESYESATPA